MSRMRRPWIAAVVVTLAGGLAPRASAQTGPQRIRMATLVPQGTSYHRILQEMGERWRVATNGQLQLTVYAGTMGSELEMVRRMRLGQLQAAALSVVGLREIDRAVGALQIMPMMFRSEEEVAFVRSRLEPVLAARLAERGFVVLFWADVGWVTYFSRRAAVMPDDFRQLKVFVTAGDNEQYDLMRSAGFSPVSLDWTDALTSLQTGMIDAVPTIPYFALAMQLNTVATHMLDLKWVPLMAAAIISKRTWDALPPASQAAIRATAEETSRRFQERGRSEGDSAVAAMRRRGLTVVPVPTPALAAWRTMSETFYPRIRGTMVPADMFDEVVRLLAEYRARPAGR